MKNEDGGSATYADLYHNEEILCRGYNNDRAKSHHMFGCSVTVKLESGDQVYVKFLAGTIYGNVYGSFTGFRVLAIN